MSDLIVISRCRSFTSSLSLPCTPRKNAWLRIAGPWGSHGTQPTVAQTPPTILRNTNQIARPITPGSAMASGVMKLRCPTLRPRQWREIRYDPPGAPRIDELSVELLGDVLVRLLSPVRQHSTHCGGRSDSLSCTSC